MGYPVVPANRAVIRTMNPNYIGFDYIGWYVGNARQTVSYFVNNYGFSVLAYRGPETGSFATTAYVVGNGAARFVFTAPLSSPDSSWDTRASKEERTFCSDLHAHLTKHGDGVKDIAFQVDEVRSVWAHAVENGAESVREPEVIKSDEGEVLIAAIRTFGDTIHTLINRSAYGGQFLPGFKTVENTHNLQKHLPKIDIVEIDHCVGNQPWDGLDGIVKYYEEALNFHRFWTVDDKEMCTDFSAMRSVVVSSPNEVIKMPMNEPTVGKKKSQIEEYACLILFYVLSSIYHPYCYPGCQLTITDSATTTMAQAASISHSAPTTLSKRSTACRSAAWTSSRCRTRTMWTCGSGCSGWAQKWPRTSTRCSSITFSLILMRAAICSRSLPSMSATGQPFSWRSSNARISTGSALATSRACLRHLSASRHYGEIYNPPRWMRTRILIELLGWWTACSDFFDIVWCELITNL